MRKIIRRILIILLLIICIYNLVPNITTVNAASLNNAIAGAQNFTNGNTTPIINSKALYDVLNVVYGFLLGVGIVVAIIRGMIIGMTIIMGTIEQKVNAKELIIPYLWMIAAIGLGGIVIRAVLKIFMDVVS